MSAGARWIADERLGRHDLGERTNNPDPIRQLAERGGVPQPTVPHTYPLTWHMDDKSLVEWFCICRDAGMVQ